jgi:hypothetical protein
VQLEHQSVIYISRNQDAITLTGNVFTGNIGLYGGAVTISSPDFTLSNALVISYMNTFDNNMAYVSGNAVWVRMTRPDNGWCGAISMLDDVFTNNFGTKITSGTVAIICD